MIHGMKVPTCYVCKRKATGWANVGEPEDRALCEVHYRQFLEVYFGGGDDE